MVATLGACTIAAPSQEQDGQARIDAVAGRDQVTIMTGPKGRLGLDERGCLVMLLPDTTAVALAIPRNWGLDASQDPAVLVTDVGRFPMGALVEGSGEEVTPDMHADPGSCAPANGVLVGVTFLARVTNK